MVITKRSIAYILLFCLAVNFMNQFYSVFLLLILGIWFMVPTYQNISKPAKTKVALLTLFALSYLLAFYSYHGFSFPKVIVILSFPCMFYIGSKWKRDQGECVESILIVIAGTAGHCFLNLYKNFSTVNLGADRSTVDFWTNTEWVITGQISLFILLAGAAYYVLFCLKFTEKPLKKLFFLFLLFGGLYYNMQLGNRTTIFATLLSLIVGWLLFCALNRKNFLYVLRYTVVAVLLIALIAFLYNIDAFGFAGWFENTSFFKRLDAGTEMDSGDMLSRWGQVYTAFPQLLTVPWGGYQMHFPGAHLDFIHNAWLNIAYGYGVIPAFLFFLFSILMVVQIFRFAKTDCGNHEKILIAGIFTAVFCYLLLEPVCEAAPQILSLMCFISGSVEQMITRKEFSIRR